LHNCRRCCAGRVSSVRSSDLAWFPRADINVRVPERQMSVLANTDCPDIQTSAPRLTPQNNGGVGREKDFLCIFLRSSRFATVVESLFLLPVCTASQVSVTVRLASLSRTSTTRDPGHHSRFVQLFCFCQRCTALLCGIDACAFRHAYASKAHDPGPAGASY
jgi:hypothetical protein